MFNITSAWVRVCACYAETEWIYHTDQAHSFTAIPTRAHIPTEPSTHQRHKRFGRTLNWFHWTLLLLQYRPSSFTLETSTNFPDCIWCMNLYNTRIVDSVIWCGWSLARMDFSFSICAPFLRHLLDFLIPFHLHLLFWLSFPLLLLL